jgi:hypothetical protein
MIMSVSALQSAIGGVAKSQSSLYKAAGRVSSVKADDRAGAILKFGDAATTYKASALTLKTARATHQSLLDAIA